RYAIPDDSILRRQGNIIGKYVPVRRGLNAQAFADGETARRLRWVNRLAAIVVRGYGVAGFIHRLDTVSLGIRVVIFRIPIGFFVMIKYLIFRRMPRLARYRIRPNSYRRFIPSSTPIRRVKLILFKSRYG